MQTKKAIWIIGFLLAAVLSLSAACSGSTVEVTPQPGQTTAPQTTTSSSGPSGGTTSTPSGGGATATTKPAGATPTVTLGNVNLKDIQGLLQSFAGKEMIVKLDDGTLVKVQVEAAKGDDPAKVVGQQVQIKASTDDKGVDTAVEVNHRGVESPDVVNKIDSITPTSVSIGGKSFKLTANTEVDPGLKPGVKARAEFSTLPDGTLLASRIEADDNGFRLSGKVDSVTDDSIVMGGQTFKRNQSTDLSEDVKAGATAKVKFEKQADNSLLATEVEKDDNSTNLNTMRFSGKLQTKDATSIVVDGKTFKVTATTKVDDTVASGKAAQVEFELKPDGSLEAKHVLNDDGSATVDSSTGGAITSVDKGSIVVGGKTFKIGPATNLDNNLAAGAGAKVEFVTLSDGSMMATRVETNVDNTKVAGALQSMTGNSFVIGGKTFTINAATRLDSGLVPGASVRVESITLPDGTQLATEIETAPREEELRGSVAEGEVGSGSAAEGEVGSGGGGGGGGTSGGGSGSGGGGGK